MNGRKAKALRRAAQEMTAGRKDREYTVTWLAPKRTTYVGQNGTPAVAEVRRAIVSLDAGCTRAVYRKIKRRSKQPGA